MSNVLDKALDDLRARVHKSVPPELWNKVDVEIAEWAKQRFETFGAEGVVDYRAKGDLRYQEYQRKQMALNFASKLWETCCDNYDVPWQEPPRYMETPADEPYLPKKMRVELFALRRIDGE